MTERVTWYSRSSLFVPEQVDRSSQSVILYRRLTRVVDVGPTLCLPSGSDDVGNGHSWYLGTVKVGVLGACRGYTVREGDLRRPSTLWETLKRP